MKTKRNILILSLAIAAVLTGCGDVEDEPRTAGAAKAVAVDMSAVETEKAEDTQGGGEQEGSATETVADPRQAPETSETETQLTEMPDPMTDPEEPQEPQEPKEPDGAEKQGGELVTPENIDSMLFGFELYNDGHKNCWEQRYDCAKIMLEAAANTDPVQNLVDLAVAPGQLNDKESSGFMTWLKFDEPMSFKVGDTVMSGCMLMMIDNDGSYYFFIGESDDVQQMFMLDDSFVPKLLAAAGV